MKGVLRAFAMSLLAIAARAHADARADVQAALQKIVDAGGFRAEASGYLFGADLPPVTGHVDVVFPDRIRARTDSMEFIVVPSGAWVRALGVWVPTDRSLLPVTAFDPRAMQRAIRSIRDVTEEGRANTTQCPARVFRFRAAGQLPGANARGDVRLWICERDGRAARMEATDSGGRRVRIDFEGSRRPVVDAPDE